MDPRRPVALELAESAFDFGVAGVADEDTLPLLALVAGHFHVDLGHQRARRVEDPQTPPFGLPADLLRYAVALKMTNRPVGDLGELLDEDRALLRQFGDDGPVVDDLVPDVDRRVEFRNGPLDDLDGAVHPGAETARIGEDDVHCVPPSRLKAEGILCPARAGGQKRFSHRPRAGTRR